MSNRRRAVARARAHERRRQWLLGGIVAVIVVAAVVAIAATRGSDDAGAQTRSVAITGTPLPPFDRETNDTAVGSTIPTVSGASFDGTPVSIANNGTPKVLLFAAHWCPHCQKEIPLLAPSLREEPLPAGVEMITVSTGVKEEAPNYPPSKWLEREGWPTPVLADDADSSAAQAFGLTSYPYFVFVDADGKVVSRYAGEMPLDEFRAAVASITDSGE